MAKGITIQLLGADELGSALFSIADGMKRRVLKRAVDKATQVFVPAIRRITPKSKPGDKSKKNAARFPAGNLRKSTGRASRRYKGGAVQSGYAGHRFYKGGKHSHLVFGGTADRYSKAGKYRGKVTANPAFKQAIEQNRGRAMEVMQAELTIGLELERQKALTKAMKKSGVKV